MMSVGVLVSPKYFTGDMFQSLSMLSCGEPDFAQNWKIQLKSLEPHMLTQLVTLRCATADLKRLV